MDISIIELLKIGFFIGVGWWGAKIIFISALSFVLKRPIQISKEES